VKALRGFKKDLVQLLVTPEDGGKSVKVGVNREFFLGELDEVPFALRRGSDEFDYGYALTVHKAQGSQWDNVLLFDESWAFRDNRTQWLYTALTRAAERITVVV
jgi:exodeoxyribonuclease-5